MLESHSGDRSRPPAGVPQEKFRTNQGLVWDGILGIRPAVVIEIV